jgi:hypothetical protein
MSVACPIPCPMRGSSPVSKGHHRPRRWMPDLHGHEVTPTSIMDHRQFLNRVAVRGYPQGSFAMANFCHAFFVGVATPLVPATALVQVRCDEQQRYRHAPVQGPLRTGEGYSVGSKTGAPSEELKAAIQECLTGLSERSRAVVLWLRLGGRADQIDRVRRQSRLGPGVCRAGRCLHRRRRRRRRKSGRANPSTPPRTAASSASTTVTSSSARCCSARPAPIMAAARNLPDGRPRRRSTNVSHLPRTGCQA